MYIRDIYICADTSIVDYYQGGFCQRFHEHTCCVVSFILSEISRKVKTDNVSKLFLKLFHLPVFCNSKQECFDGVLEENFHFDFDQYNLQGITNQNRKKMIAIFLREKINQFCDQYSWDFTPFQLAFDKLEQIKYDIKLESKKIWVSPDKRFKTKVVCYYDIDVVILEAHLHAYRKKQLFCKKFLGKMRPNDFLFYTIDRTCKWESNTTFVSQGPGFARTNFSVDFSVEINSLYCCPVVPKVRRKDAIM